ncbi:MAG TPA: class I SAM-dependent methyltransferase [Thermoleophilaceae bacterium]|jgi:SAM-dependent methyltransferase|nr:class I SAM-dependent methyltransferase [Thermoleophilaceae bacterium]
MAGVPEWWRYIGRRVECPVCDGRFRKWAPGEWRDGGFYGNPVRCPRCWSLPRHRVLWLYLEPRVRANDFRSILHVAPERAIAPKLERAASRYVSADLEPGRAMVVADLTALPFEDGSFDLLVCSHVLEHVPDDRAAMREMHRVLSPRGMAVIQTPVNYDQEHTYENPGETDPAVRLSQFSQDDHVRVYGPDLVERLSSSGFSIDLVDPIDWEPALVERHGLQPRRRSLRNDLFACRPASS